MPESVHEKLKRVRKPHVHITMDIDGEGLPVHELPFVVGVMGDFVGDPDEKDPPKPMAERKFIEIDRDSFNDVMARLKPGLRINVPDTLSGKPDQMLAVDLQFKSMDDFHPDRLVESVPVLKKLLEVRQKLHELESTAQKGKGLEALLERILENKEEFEKLRGELPAESSGSGEDKNQGSGAGDEQS